MHNQGEEHWLTYAEAADLLGISTEAARLRARRYKWPRRTPNEPGAVARVLVPDDDRGTDRQSDRPQPALTGGRPADDRRTNGMHPPGHDLPVTGPDIARTVREAVELLVKPLSAQLDIANRRADEALAEARDTRRQLHEERARTADALTAERIARDEAAGQRAELDARREWGLRRRLRWALGRR
jgi:hypothetical protein